MVLFILENTVRQVQRIELYIQTWKDVQDIDVEQLVLQKIIYFNNRNRHGATNVSMGWRWVSPLPTSRDAF